MSVAAYLKKKKCDHIQWKKLLLILTEPIELDLKKDIYKGTNIVPLSNDRHCYCLQG